MELQTDLECSQGDRRRIVKLVRRILRLEALLMKLGVSDFHWLFTGG